MVEGEDIAFTVMRESGRNVAREMVRKGGQAAVPIIIVDSEVVVGFDKPKLDALLS